MACIMSDKITGCMLSLCFIHFL